MQRIGTATFLILKILNIPQSYRLSESNRLLDIIDSTLAMVSHIQYTYQN